MRIVTKALGSKKPLFADFSIGLPPEGLSKDGGDVDITLRDLIERIVRHEVAAFRQRQSDRQFVRILTEREIELAAEKGKVEMGASEVGRQSVDEDSAVQAAWVAFADGLYLVIIDEVQYTNLDQAVFLSPESQMTFVRLTLLSGG